MKWRSRSNTNVLHRQIRPAPTPPPPRAAPRRARSRSPSAWPPSCSQRCRACGGGSAARAAPSAETSQAEPVKCPIANVRSQQSGCPAAKELNRATASRSPCSRWRWLSSSAEHLLLHVSRNCSSRSRSRSVAGGACRTGPCRLCYRLLRRPGFRLNNSERDSLRRLSHPSQRQGINNAFRASQTAGPDSCNSRKEGTEAATRLVPADHARHRRHHRHRHLRADRRSPPKRPARA